MISSLKAFSWKSPSPQRPSKGWEWNATWLKNKQNLTRIHQLRVNQWRKRMKNSHKTRQILDYRSITKKVEESPLSTIWTLQSPNYKGRFSREEKKLLFLLFLLARTPLIKVASWSLIKNKYQTVSWNNQIFKLSQWVRRESEKQDANFCLGICSSPRKKGTLWARRSGTTCTKIPRSRLRFL